MRKPVSLALLFLCLSGSGALAAAADQEPFIYTVAPGDTLWGLSQRFLDDPNYWPNLWAGNQSISNPHFIYPGQKLRFYKDHFEVVEPPTPDSAPTSPQTRERQSGARTLPEEPQPRGYTVTGGEGFLMEKAQPPAGMIVSTHDSREIVGADDIVYTDIGRLNGANVGDRFTIYKKMGAVSHPVTNVILGEKVVPLGELQLSEVEDKVSKAIITRSYQEITPGAYLVPCRQKKVTVPLRGADRDLIGYIVETKPGNDAIGVRDVVYLDLGCAQGLKAGNLLYIVRDVVPEQRYSPGKIESLPVEVIGALVVLETGTNTSTALIVKSVDTVYRGDRVELKKSR